MAKAKSSSSQPTPDSAAAQWSGDDEKVLVDFLDTKSAAAGDGCSFKMTTFNEASVVLDEKRGKGGRKTAKACQNKWNSLRRTFRAIQAIKGKSGWTWSDETGASITPDMEPAWADFIKSHPLAKPFKNKGWVHLEKMTKLMPATVKGAHVFRPSQGISGLDTSFDDAQDDETQEEPEDSPEVDEHVENTPTIVTIPSTPPRASRKRERAISTTPAPSSKKGKMTGPDAIHGLTVSISRFGDNICKAMAGDPTQKTPQRHTKAVKLAQEEDWLPARERLLFCNVVENNIKAADAYLALNPDDIEFRRLWIQKKVDDSKKAEENW
ncbi:hypothetical protein GALMADRAFT_144655 [Galerina marginata CBS 339.88]|uniref:Myb/SANT-like domain-containing protein n=1 Tax=Galerina marginata (strain CBS 339.88) TaxID=685588 RepID=A0A067SHC6_GALM3|nr:hypothetical protein GALMADRAFT_144655 [Galerina marginata CBS 339.88]